MQDTLYKLSQTRIILLNEQHAKISLQQRLAELKEETLLKMQAQLFLEV